MDRPLICVAAALGLLTATPAALRGRQDGLDLGRRRDVDLDPELAALSPLGLAASAFRLGGYPSSINCRALIH
jgi:hypothetical protein